jgi:hypothetical protein
MEKIMKPKEILWVLFLAIAALILNGKPTWSQSVGGTQSERSGGDSQIPVAPSSGDPSKAQKGAAGASQSPSGTTQGKKDTSVGGSQSERSGGDSQTPLPKGSRSAGSEDAMKASKGPLLDTRVWAGGRMSGKLKRL